MTYKYATALKTKFNEEIALQHVDVNVEFEDLVSNVTVKQTYTNNEAVDIEAVYTFPLPNEAVLLHLNVEIGGRSLKGVIVEKAKAENKYESAITDGDTAIMLEKLEPGLYSMNVGNLAVGETAIISFTYGILNKWKGDSVRFSLPATYVPRYGNPAKAGLKPHQIPEANLLVENKFSLSMTIAGELANADIQCPSHEVTLEQQGKNILLNLKHEQAFMDRTFVVLFETNTEQSSTALSCKDDELHLVMASFNPKFSTENSDIGHCINMVVDCSGSMHGISIRQAKFALRRILTELSSLDHFNIIAFGSHTKTLFRGPRLASEENISQAVEFTSKLNADLGGTEVMGALEVAYLSRCEGQSIQEDILLITDGEVWASEDIIEKATQSGQRIFTVGVGSSVSEAFLGRLSDKTGGACELISPNENMANNIFRHYQRMYTPKAEKIMMNWGAVPERQFPNNINTVFSGDTLHMFGWFKEPIKGKVILEMESNGAQYQCEAVNREIDANTLIAEELPRLAISNVISESNDRSAAEKLAIKYQLVSKWTNYIIIDKRAEGEKIKALPELRSVPHMSRFALNERHLMSASHNALPTTQAMRTPQAMRKPRAMMDAMDIGVFAVESYDSSNYEKDLIKKINGLSAGSIVKLTTFDDFVILVGIRQHIDELRLLSTQFAVDERVVLFVYLHIVKSNIEGIDRQQKRAIEKGYKIHARNFTDLDVLTASIEKLIIPSSLNDLIPFL